MTNIHACPHCGHAIADHEPIMLAPGGTEYMPRRPDGTFAQRCQMPYDADGPSYGCGCTDWLEAHLARLPGTR